MPLAWPAPQPDPTKANTKEADIRTVMMQEYSDHGQWARHYSTVRMTLGTFAFTAAVGMITVRWEQPQLALAVAAAIVLLIGVVLFAVFSVLTFHKMNEQLEIVDSYNQQLDPPASGTSRKPIRRLGFFKWGTGWPIAALFLVLFLFFDGWWLYSSKSQSARTRTISVPMTVKVGQQPEVSVDIPIRVSIP